MAEIQVKSDILGRDIEWIEGPDGKPWVVFDFFRPLGYRDAHQATRYIDPSYVSHSITLGKSNGGGRRNSRTIISEPGLYQLLMTSRKDEVKPFKEWLANVCVQIRETGRYEAPGLTPTLTSDGSSGHPPVSTTIAAAVPDPNEHPLVAQVKMLAALTDAFLATEKAVNEAKAKAAEAEVRAFAAETISLETKKDVAAIAGKIEDASEAIDALMGATKDDSGYFFAIPYLEKMRVRIPPNMRGIVGGECRKIAQKMDYNPYAFPTGPHGGFDGVRKFPKEVMHAWYAANRGNPARAAWFPLQIHG